MIVQVPLTVGSPLMSAVLGFLTPEGEQDARDAQTSRSAWGHVQHSIEAGTMTGFQLAAAAGPLCDEPLWGVAFEVYAFASRLENQTCFAVDEHCGVSPLSCGSPSRLGDSSRCAACVRVRHCLFKV